MSRARPGAGVLAALPLKAFTAAKGRLEGVLEPSARVALSRAMAERVAAAWVATGAVVVVVTPDPGVAAWARGLGLEVLADPPEGGLNGAAAAAAAEAARRGSPWAIVHADLPLLTSAEAGAFVSAWAPRAAVLAPSRQGGTNLLAAAVPFGFSYGPGSFARHLAAARGLERRVMVTAGTALDLDTPEDLRGAAALPGGAWLRPFLT